VFVALHVNAAATKTDVFAFQSKALFDGVISAELDLSAGSQDAVPGQANRSVKGPRHQPGAAAETGGARDRTIGRDFATRDRANQRQNFLTSFLGS
jgi:hypothetical protein